MRKSLSRSANLKSLENDKVTSHLRAGFNSAGDLVLEGHDTGDFVEQMWGHDDYEYWLTVRKEFLPRLVKEFGRQLNQPIPTEVNQQAFVMEALIKLFSEGSTPLHFVNDSEFKKWLDELGIPSEFSSWP
jgi:hypothetical protein